MFNIKRRERRINYGEGEKNFIQRLLSSKSGRIVFISGVILIVLLLVFMSAPTKKEMIREVNDNVMQCLEDNNRYKGDAIDDFVHNLGYAFTEADTAAIVPEILETYQKYNQLEAHRHLFYSTAYIHNNTHPEGTRVAIGFLMWSLFTKAMSRSCSTQGRSKRPTSAPIPMCRNITTNRIQFTKCISSFPKR